MKKPSWLVAYDFSPSAHSVAEKALEELEVQRGTLYLVHVFHAPPIPTSFETGGSGSVFDTAGDFSNALLKNAESHLEQVKNALVPRFTKVAIHAIVREGDTVDEILGTAKEESVDRIVVGTHGRKGVSRVLMGSVAERIVRLSPISVLVIKTSED